MEKKSAQKVRIQNRYAVAEYDTLEDAADALSSIGVLPRDEVMSLLSDRVGWINGFAVTYE